MAFFSVNHIAITGLSCCVPANEVFNKDFPYHTKKENQQFLETTGIEKRNIVKNGVTAADLCFKAADELLKSKKIDRSDITVLIFLSQTPDYKIPCTATILQNKLHLANTNIAFDINLGCSGYVYGLSVIAAMLNVTKGKALLLVGDTSSTCINQEDKTTAPLFSDAGSATLLEYNKEASSMHFNLQSDGTGYDAIITRDGGARNPIDADSLRMDEVTKRRAIDMHLDGIKVFNFSRKEVAPNILALLENNNIDEDILDYFLFHQANLFMNESIRKKLSLPKEKVPYSLKEYGNTSSASIPITMVHCLEDELNARSVKLVLSGFGVGLSWGSVYLELNRPTVLPMLKI